MVSKIPRIQWLRNKWPRIDLESVIYAKIEPRIESIKVRYAVVFASPKVRSSCEIKWSESVRLIENFGALEGKSPQGFSSA